MQGSFCAGDRDIHKHSKNIANERNPIHKLNMNISAVRRLGIYSHIKKNPPS
jgi:hypothetical protein